MHPVPGRAHYTRPASGLYHQLRAVYVLRWHREAEDLQQVVGANAARLTMEYLKRTHSSDDLVHEERDDDGAIVKDDHGRPVMVYAGDELDE